MQIEKKPKSKKCVYFTLENWPKFLNIKVEYKNEKRYSKVI